MIIIDKKSLKILEFNKILNMLAEYITSPLGAELLDNISVYTNIKQVEYQLKATSEARYLIAVEKFSLQGLKDMRPTLNRARINAVPSIEGLINVSSSLKCASKALRLINNKAGDVPLIAEMVVGIPDLKFIATEIDNCIDESGFVKDNASAELRNIRRQISRLESQIKTKVESMIQSATYSKYLQDNLVTVRQDRYVIPVKIEYRQQVPGIIHDRSSSGSTLFIEPMAVVELNNKLREYEQLEIKEVERILRELGGLLHDYYDPLQSITDVMGVLDLLNARGRLSLNMNAIEPKLNNNQFISLLQARHPLIKRSEVVPLDIKLGREYQVLVITGPNTGGKTVSLKCVGLMQLMAQSGLHIPADINSEVSVFNNILADIGDEQSIEQSLSTFSSHMTNIIRLLEAADDKSLVLLDELGAGTDPVEGAALAMSIIDELLYRGTYVIATTHYSELKAYAYNHPQITNGSVEFDVETLQPTYKLSIGVPGRSNALLIASRLGLPRTVIAGAEQYISSEDKHVESMISELEANRKSAERANLEAERYKNKSIQIYREYEEKLAKLSEQEQEIRRNAVVEAKEYLSEAQRDMEEIIAELQNEIKSLKDQRDIEESIKQARAYVSEKMSEVNAEAKSLYKHPLQNNIVKTNKNETLEIGMNVKHRQWAREGVIVSEANDKEQVQVQFGSMKMWVDGGALEVLDRIERPTSKVIITRSEESRQIPLELDIRGKAVHEAEEVIDRYLDSAILGARNEVFIIHGKGTGALRAGVREYLSQHPYVAKMRLGGPGEGGHGVTIVELRK